jgi:hypothetical protein
VFLWPWREELCDRYLKRTCKPVDDVERRVSTATLDPRNIGAVKLCSVREVFLRPSTPNPELSHSCAERGAVGWNGHLSTVRLS